MPKDLFAKIDGLLRGGKLAEAKTALEKSRLRNFEGEMLTQMCLLARRCGLPGLALRWLTPVVRPQGRKRTAPNGDHYTEYGGALIQVGSVLEGMKMLEQLPSPVPARAHLYWAFGCFARWEYARSIPRLEAYVADPGISDYERAVGQANLAAALAYERTPKAHDYLVELVRGFSEKKYDRLRINVLMSLADLCADTGSFGEGRKVLREAERALGGPTSLESLFLAKWFAVLDLRERVAGAEKKIESVRDRAEEAGHWETIRNLDYHLAVCHRDEKKLAQVYFGTPFDSLRTRLVRDAGGWTPPTSYDWIPRGASAGDPRLDFSDPLILENEFAKLKAGPAGLRLVMALLSDHYRPFSVGAIHALVHPDEHYNHLSSPNRIHQLLKRTRLAVQNRGLRFSEVAGQYSLKDSIVRIGLSAETAPRSREDLWLLKLASHFPSPAAFTAQEVVKILEGNYWTIVRWLQSRVESGDLLKTGAARSTRYHLADGPAVTATDKKNRREGR